MESRKITVGEGSAHPLNGLLTLPDSTLTPVPAVIMVHGSGPSNMDEKVMKLTPFKDIAEGLAKRGIASIRYDKRTYIYTKEMRNSTLTVREETIDDALLAAELLKQAPEIDSGSIYILGHSMGAMLAPRIDAEGADVQGLILMAGTPYRLEEVVINQLKRSGDGNPLLKMIVRAEYKIFSKKFTGLYEMTDEEAEKKKFAGGIPLYYFKEMGRKTAADYLLESEKPALIMQGGKDFQVLADDDFIKFKELLEGRPNTVFKLYPELNHCFTDAIYSSILKASKEYGTERRVSEEAIGDIADFILGTQNDR